MAFETLRPHQSQILGLINQGRTLAQVIDVLAAQHGVATTPGTLSRFASSLRATPPRQRVVPPAPASAAASTELTSAQHVKVDDIALKTELLAEIHASRQESRDILDHLAGKIAGLTGDVTELELAVGQQGLETRDHVTKALNAMALPASAAVAPPSVPARVILRIWLRAFVITGLFWATIAVILLTQRRFLEGSWDPV